MKSKQRALEKLENVRALVRVAADMLGEASDALGGETPSDAPKGSVENPQPRSLREVRESLHEAESDLAFHAKQ